MVKTVKTMRHGLAVRLVHWAIVAEGAFLLLTGFQMSGLLYLGLPEYTYSLHIIVGFMFIVTAFVFLYTVLAAHDFRWFSLRRIPYSIRYIWAETLYWFRLRPTLEEPIRFDPKKGDYVEKLIPSVIVVWWTYAAMGIILALTGLTDAFPTQFWWVSAVLNPIGMALTGTSGLPFILSVHRLVAILLIVTVALHLYASLVYHLVPSIIRGYRNEPVAESTGAPGMQNSSASPPPDTIPKTKPED
jgi:methanophenazine hydrogenase, cytochrome b subunit